MTSLNRLLTCAVAGALVATASCGGDGSSPVETEPDTEDFNLLTGCSGTCVGGFLAMIDGFNDIMMWLAVGKESTGGDPFLDLATGAFGFSLNMDGEWGNEIQFLGTISPLEERCGDGMTQGEVCVAEWDMSHTATEAHMGEGTFSIVHLGMTGAPDNTPSFRVTIVNETPWMTTADGCKLVITAMQLIVHPFGDPQLTSALVSFKMTSEGTSDAVNGDLMYAYDPTAKVQSMSLTGEFTAKGKTTNVSCTVDLDTYELKCS
jgi:hypothetical protein